jgi:hypothetical protein
MRALFTLGLCGLLFACGDDDDDRPRRTIYSSGVSGSIEITTLGDADLERICQSYDVFVEANVGFDAIAYAACLPGAIVAGGDEAGCNRLLDECMEGFPEPIMVRAQLRDQEVCFESLLECQASVAELEGCINLSLDFVLDVLDGWSCSGVDDDDMRKAAAKAQDTAQVCADIDAACNRFVTLGPE